MLKIHVILPRVIGLKSVSFFENSESLILIKQDVFFNLSEVLFPQQAKHDDFSLSFSLVNTLFFDQDAISAGK